MNKVITINLNGRAYQLEESGYEALRAYLDDASAQLAEDPGKTEIIADLEQAIAEKCDKVLSPYKTVVSSDEVTKIIAEMGPVEGGADSAKKEDGQAHSDSALKRLYLIREGAVLAGVCTGIAAYFGVDVTIVRIIFIALTVFTGGIWILAYLALALLVPYADTGEARAAAHGQTFNAQDIVDRAKERVQESLERFTGTKMNWSDTHDWHKWKQEMKQQKQQRKHEWRAMRRSQYGYRRSPVLGLITALLAILWIWALVTLVTQDMVFGWMVPAGIPIWVSIVILFVVYHAVTGPMKAGNPHQWQNGQLVYNYNYSAWDGVGDGLTVLFLVIAFGWAYLHVPQVYTFVHHPIMETKAAVEWLKLHSWVKATPQE